MRLRTVLVLMSLSALIAGFVVRLVNRPAPTVALQDSSVPLRTLKPQQVQLVDRDGTRLAMLSIGCTDFFSQGNCSGQTMEIFAGDPARMYGLETIAIFSSGNSKYEMSLGEPVRVNVGMNLAEHRRYLRVGGPTPTEKIFADDLKESVNGKAVVRKGNGISLTVPIQQLRLATEDRHVFAVIGLDRYSSPTIAFVDGKEHVLASVLFDLLGLVISFRDENEEPSLYARFSPGKDAMVTVVHADLYRNDPATRKQIPVPAEETYLWRDGRSIPWLKKLVHKPNFPLMLTGQNGDELWRYPSVSEPEAWPDIALPQLGKANASLATEWREGRLYYQFSIDRTPILAAAQTRSERQVGNTRVLSPPELRVEFYDKDTFKLLELKLPLPNLFAEIDEHGKQQRLTARDSTECSLQKYQSIRAWNLAWLL